MLLRVGSLAGVIGGYDIIATSHHVSGWTWLAVGLLLVVLAQVRAVQAATAQVEQGQQAAVTQTAVAVGEGAQLSPDALHMTGSFTMIAGAAEVNIDRRRTKRRWFPRQLPTAAWSWLNAAKPALGRCLNSFIARNCHQPLLRLAVLRLATRNGQSRAENNKRRADTETQMQTRFAARVRDLLNEAVESGYSLSEEMEEIRAPSGPAGQGIQSYNEQAVAEGIGVVGLRVRRGSKRL